MNTAIAFTLPRELATALEARFFWWTPVGEAPRSDLRILAQAMNLASFDDVRQLETTLGSQPLVDAMSHAEPGWFDARSWEFWRGRLAYQTGKNIPDRPPFRCFDG